MEGALDIEKRYVEPAESASFAVKKDEVGPADLRLSLLRYVMPRVALGGIRESTTYFAILHHVPSLIAGLPYLEVLYHDLTEISQSPGFKVFMRDYLGPTGRDTNFYFGTNKDYAHHWQHDPSGWNEQLERVHEEVGIPTMFDCIDPHSIGKNLEQYPQTERVLTDVLRQPDGITVEISESGLQIRPFVTCDVLTAQSRRDAYVFNVDARTPLAAQRITSLEGLQDILSMTPDENRIESFLRDHPDVFGKGYVDFRTQVTIAPTGERPDFFLERLDGLWDVLELKRPMPPSRLFVGDPAGVPKLAQYLEESLRQCIKYLRLLESKDSRNRLSSLGIKIDEPRITLLIGRKQYPTSVVELVQHSYDKRITLRSFEELFDDCKRDAASILKEMKSLAVPSE
jgi:hypothetical protein